MKNSLENLNVDILGLKGYFYDSQKIFSVK